MFLNNFDFYKLSMSILFKNVILNGLYFILNKKIWMKADLLQSILHPRSFKNPENSYKAVDNFYFVRNNFQIM